eukprot:Gb_25485 [translate_table: standard]
MDQTFFFPHPARSSSLILTKGRNDGYKSSENAGASYFHSGESVCNGRQAIQDLLHQITRWLRASEEGMLQQLLAGRPFSGIGQQARSKHISLNALENFLSEKAGTLRLECLVTTSRGVHGE